VDPKGAYFTRGSGHDQFGRYTEDSEEYTQVVDRLRRKIDSAATHVPAPEVVTRSGAEMAIISIGSCHPAVLEALKTLEDDGIPLDYLRIRGFPFDQSVERFIDDHDRSFVVEQNRDGQLLSLITLETDVPKGKLASVLYYGGQPLSAHHVVTGIKELLQGDGQVAALGDDALGAPTDVGGVEGRLGGVEV
jgi:2-oxoglutarate ferredoxin oxidoreductase subunit alpha